eukprot:TRINITY_DN5711_c0_g1_i1.p1 TRINITY_DN5711_c0_g1~~TRINITY_DN5711_c0_g1_i1.p1  ORF type:complete len:796 (+),score=102.54 TRINITY_DN5711_c0_g1_i1:289-2676(+)
MLVLDGSQSLRMDGWEKVKQFATTIADSFAIGPGQVRVGLVQFSSRELTKLEFGLSSNPSYVKTSITKMEYQNSRTDITKGLRLAREELETNGRRGVKRIVIMMTDGEDNEMGNPEEEAARVKAMKNTELYIVGVGKYVNPSSLKHMVSSPVDQHYFFAQDFTALLSLIDNLVTYSCSFIDCSKVSPNHGPLVGGTVIKIGGEGFSDGPVLCRFGNKTFPGERIDEDHVSCVSTPGEASGQTVVFEVSTDGGKKFTSSFCQFTYEIENGDPCSAWDESCDFCLEHSYCGFCSNKVTLEDGSLGSQCAGFYRDGKNEGEQDFVCVGTYHTEDCPAGYECSLNNATCELAAPGTGSEKEECDAGCGLGHIYKCNDDLHVCELCENGTPGCVDHVSCKKGCLLPDSSSPEPSQPPSPVEEGVPKELVGTIWRGLQINQKPVKGEFQMKFSSDIVQVVDPDGSGYIANVSYSGQHLIFLPSNGFDAGKVIYVKRDQRFVGEFEVDTFANNVPGVSKFAKSFDSRMSKSFGVEVWIRCLLPRTCSFRFEEHPTQPLPFVRRSISSGDKLADHDICSVFTTCDSCVEQPTCGYCSTPVKYNDGSIGTNCGGFNLDDSKRPFVCKGTYSSNSCDASVPPQVYYCDDSFYGCVETIAGNGTTYETCQNECNEDNFQPVPVTPPALQGKWRGLLVQANYTLGEYIADFSATEVVISDNANNVIIRGSVSSTVREVWITNLNGVYRGIWQIVYGPETGNVQIAFGSVNGRAPSSFRQASQNERDISLFLTSCLAQKYSQGICSFD